MLTEDTIIRKKLGCIDLVTIVFNIDKAGIKYKINNDGSLSIFNAEMTLVYEPETKKWKGYINDVPIEGSFKIRNRYPEIIFLCDKDSRRVVLDN